MTAILHVAESFGGGVATAISEYMRSTPELEHYLLYGSRSEVTIDSWNDFAWTRELPKGVAGIKAIRRAVKELNPDIVHAHSSWAGLFARVSLNAIRTPIVYTPHCFAFERRDIPKHRRAIYRGIERILALNTSVIAGCSPHEAHVGATWLGAERAIYVPNIARADRNVLIKKSPRRVVAMGRLSIQKDPPWFADLVRELPADTEAIWIGDGDDKYRLELEAVGAAVTGWIPRDEAMSLLASAQVHVLPSLWEGFPMAILEAFAEKVPTVSRRMSMLPELPTDESFVNAPQAAERVARILDESPAAEQNLARWADALVENTPRVQRERLLNTYATAASGTPGPATHIASWIGRK